MYATPSNNYWKVGDQPSDQRWSSASVAYVGDTDATYLAWLAEGYLTSEIDTEQELADLLNETYPEGSPIPAPPLSTALAGPISVESIIATTSLSGSITVADGVYKLQVWGQAAGGGGGGCNGVAAQAGGGGGAGETRLAILSVSPGDVIDYSIGAPGAAAGTASDLTIGGSAAAFPEIIASKAKAEGPSSTSHIVTLPTGIEAGDLLVLFCEVQLGTITTPSGWTIGYNTTFAAFAGNARAEMFYRIADGSEGTSLTLTSSNSEQMNSVVHQIRGHDPVTPLQISFASATSASPNPPSCTLSPAVAKPCLWLAACHSQDKCSGAPTGFADPVTDPNNVQNVYVVSKNDNVSSLDPGTGFALTGIDNKAHTVATIAVYPLTPVTLMTCKGGTNGTGASGGANGTNGTTPTGSGGARIPPTAGPLALSNAGANAFFFSRGGSCMFGDGGVQTRATTAGGNVGAGPGGGGSGAGNGSGTTVQTGGAGAPGMILVMGFGA